MSNPTAQVVLDGDGAFAEQQRLFGEMNFHHEQPSLRIVRLPNGMKPSGKSSVAIGVELMGEYFVIETSLALLNMAVQAMKTRDEMEGRPACDS